MDNITEQPPVETIAAPGVVSKPQKVTEARDYTPQIDEAPDAPESMQHLFDSSEGKIIQVPSSTVPGLLADPKYVLPTNGSQYVLDKKGQLQQVPNSSYKEALSSGEFVPATDADVRKEMFQQKYGDSEMAAAGVGTLRGITMGLSDPFLSKIVGKGTLAGLEEANPSASMAGEVAGTIGGLLLPVGPLAKTAQMGAKATEIAASAGIRALEKAGVKSSVAASIVSKVGAAAVGSAVEGAAFGAGHLVSESSLGKADFNAENLAAEAGAGALFGAAVGGIFGSIGAAAPAVSAKAGKLFDDLQFFNKAKNTEDFLAVTPSKASKLRARDEEIFNKAADAFADESKIGIKALDSDATILQKTTAFKERAGQQIGNALEAVKAAGDDILPVAKDFYSSLKKTSKAIREEAEMLPGIAAPEKKALHEAISNYEMTYKQLADKSAAGAKLSIDELQKMHRSLADSAKFDMVKNTDPAKIAIAKQLWPAVRQEIDAVASRAGKEVGAGLKSANADYYLASKLEPLMESKVSKSVGISLKDVAGGLIGESVHHGLGALFVSAKKAMTSDFKRKAVILGTVEKANMSIDKAISNSTTKFFSDSIKKVYEPAAVKSLVDFSLSRNEEGKKPKDRFEAFKNLQTNLTDLASSPEKVMGRVQPHADNLAVAAPETAGALSMVGQNAIQFLASKMPKRQSYPGVVPRPWHPSSMEMHKFERYIGAIENPKAVINNFANGRMSREESEALQAVYPNLFTRLQENVIANIKHSGQHMNYQKKMQMGVLLNLVTDPSLAPENILSLQANFTKPPEQGSGMVTPSVKGMQNLHLDEKMKLGGDSED
jgi:hypothetical protein